MTKRLLLVALFTGLCQADTLDDGVKAVEKKDYKNAIELYTKACDSGDVMGCRILGYMYANGTGVKQDSLKVFEHYTKACDGGDAMGCRILGYMYANGGGIK